MIVVVVLRARESLSISALLSQPDSLNQQLRQLDSFDPTEFALHNAFYLSFQRRSFYSYFIDIYIYIYFVRSQGSATILRGDECSGEIGGIWQLAVSLSEWRFGWRFGWRFVT